MDAWLDASGVLRAIPRHAVACVTLVVLSSAPLGAQTIYTVDSTADGGDADTADGLCDDGSGACTLRAALEQANASAGLDRIHFGLAADGPYLIQPDTLPHITDPVVIDGYSQPGASPNANGPEAGSNAVILIVVDVRANSSLLTTRGPTISAGGSTVRGLALHGGDLWSIRLISGDGNVIEGNMLGDPDNGSSDAVVLVQSSDNTIGGASPTARNVISGGDDGIRIASGSGNLVAGNLIGTDATGSLVRGNHGSGVAVTQAAVETIIGGAVAGARNVIAGSSSGITVDGAGTTGTTIHGNYIGLDVTGSGALGIGSDGISLAEGTSFTSVGGSLPGQGNVIAAAGDPAIRIHSSDNTIQGNLIGLDATGTTALPNDSEGIYLDAGASRNRIGGTTAGAGNSIANSGTIGIAVVGDGTANTISGNSLFDNPIGIDLGYDGVTANDVGDSDSGPNHLLNFPDLAVAYTGNEVAAVEGSYSGLAGGMFTLEFFASDLCNALGYGEGERFVGSTTVATDGAGQSTFSAPVDVLVSPGEAVTATATDADGNTSELSNCVIGSGFTVTVVPETVVVAAGQTASFTVSVTKDGPLFDQPVALSCAGTLPPGSSCSFSPPRVTPGAGTATSTLSVVGFTALTSQPVGTPPIGANGPPADLGPSSGLSGLGLVSGLIALLVIGARFRRRAAYRTALALGCATVLVSGCSEDPIVPEDPISWTFQVTGTSGPLQESAPATVTVE